MKKAVQYFSDEYLDYCRQLTPAQILEFLENFRKLHLRPVGKTTRSKLISIKVPVELLEVFKMTSESQGLRYQSQIKNLMRIWVEKEFSKIEL